MEQRRRLLLRMTLLPVEQEIRRFAIRLAGFELIGREHQQIL
ncbi:hypothetical protein BN133_2716 [Cronobacter dublinensis 582]|nr:hypothetical protein BN133_2716 [Cronobacter dublinensis 582]